MIWPTFKNIQKYKSQWSKCCSTEVFQGKGISLIQKYFGGWRHSKHTIPCLCQWNVGTAQNNVQGWRALEDQGNFEWKTQSSEEPGPTKKPSVPIYRLDSEFKVNFRSMNYGFQNLVPGNCSCILQMYSSTLDTNTHIHTHTHWTGRRDWASSSYYI